jgi:hypothetical protein
VGAPSWSEGQGHGGARVEVGGVGSRAHRGVGGAGYRGWARWLREHRGQGRGLLGAGAGVRVGWGRHDRAWSVRNGCFVVTSSIRSMTISSGKRIWCCAVITALDEQYHTATTVKYTGRCYSTFEKINLFPSLYRYSVLLHGTVHLTNKSTL